MKILAICGAAALAGAVAVGFSAQGGATPGQAAPLFTLTDTNGKAHNLADYKGKYVVLEWLNYGCPYVQTHYESGNMPGLQKAWTAKGVVWLSIVTSPPGQQGYFEPAEMNEQTKKVGGKGTAILYDSAGTTGRAYGARTTPHMFVISPEGKVLYAGGIDNKAVAKPQEDPSVTNYVTQALNEAMAGKEVSVKSARPYGCGVKYAK